MAKNIVVCIIPFSHIIDYLKVLLFGNLWKTVVFYKGQDQFSPLIKSKNLLVFLNERTRHKRIFKNTPFPIKLHAM